MSEADIILKADDICKSFGAVEVLKGISLEAREGDVISILGSSGSGKSTLSYVLAGRDGYEVTAGSVTYMGQDLLSLIDRLLKFDLRGRAIGGGSNHPPGNRFERDQNL